MPGVRSDVGGGYWLDGLSDLALEFMIGELSGSLGEDILLETGPEQIRALLDAQGDQLADVALDDVIIRPLARGTVHAHEGIAAKVAGSEPRSVHVCEHDRPLRGREGVALPPVHRSVTQRFGKVPGYRPTALRGTGFRLLQSGQARSGKLEGMAGLMDFTLPETA